MATEVLTPVGCKALTIVPKPYVSSRMRRSDVVHARWVRRGNRVVAAFEHDSGGHFAAYTKPNELTNDLRMMFGKGDSAYMVSSPERMEVADRFCSSFICASCTTKVLNTSPVNLPRRHLVPQIHGSAFNKCACTVCSHFPDAPEVSRSMQSPQV